jgi:hypothetical protein
MKPEEIAQIFSNLAMATARSPETAQGAQASNQATQAGLSSLYEKRLAEEQKKKKRSGIAGSIGATLGGALGTALIPIPGVGTAIGSAIGGGLGSAAGGGDFASSAQQYGTQAIASGLADYAGGKVANMGANKVTTPESSGIPVPTGTKPGTNMKAAPGANQPNAVQPPAQNAQAPAQGGLLSDPLVRDTLSALTRNVIGGVLGQVGGNMQQQGAPVSATGGPAQVGQGTQYVQGFEGRDVAVTPGQAPPQTMAASGGRDTQSFKNRLLAGLGEGISNLGNSYTGGDSGVPTAETPIGLNAQTAAAMRAPYIEQAQRSEDIAREMSMFDKTFGLQERAQNSQEQAQESTADFQDRSLAMDEAQLRIMRDSQTVEQAIQAMEVLQKSDSLTFEKKIQEDNLELQRQGLLIDSKRLDIEASSAAAQAALNSAQSATEQTRAETALKQAKTVELILNMQSSVNDAIKQIGDPKLQAYAFMAAQAGNFDVVGAALQSANLPDAVALVQKNATALIEAKKDFPGLGGGSTTDEPGKITSSGANGATDAFNAFVLNDIGMPVPASGPERFKSGDL